MEWTNLTKTLDLYGEKLVEAYRGRLKSEGVNASGDLSDSVAFKVDYDGRIFEVSLNLRDYWKYVEKGRKPGKWPPIGAIERWIQVKPVIPRPYNGKVPTEKQLAFLIARKIGTEGIQPRPILQNSVRDTNEEMMEAIAEAFAEDCSRDLDEILTIFAAV